MFGGGIVTKDEGRTTKKRPIFESALSLAGGFFMLLMGAVVAAGSAGGLWVSELFDFVMVVVPLVTGVAVLLGAVMLLRSPDQHRRWGTVILVFSVISILGLFSIFGAFLGIVGGALGRSWNPIKAAPPQLPSPVQPKRGAGVIRSIAAGGFFVGLISILLAVLGAFGYGGLIGILVFSPVIVVVAQRVLKWAHG